MRTEPMEGSGQPHPERAPGKAVLLMVFTCACFAGMSAAIRHVSAEISVFQIAFVRNGIGTLILLPFMLRIGFGSFDLGRFRLFAVRARDRRLRHVGLVFGVADDAARGSHHAELHGLALG